MKEAYNPENGEWVHINEIAKLREENEKLKQEELADASYITQLKRKVENLTLSTFDAGKTCISCMHGNEKNRPIDPYFSLCFDCCSRCFNNWEER